VPTPEQIRAAVEAYVAAYNADDRGAFVALWSDDAVIEDPVGTPAHRGRDAIAAFWDGVHQLSERIRLTPGHVHVAGDGAAMVFEIRAAGMVIDAVDVFVVDDTGAITSMRAYWDLAEGRPES
jgi:steroid Delta-isomerase